MRVSGIRHVPVVDSAGEAIGILSDRDLLKALARGASRTVTVGRIMSRRVQCIAPDAPAREAAELMIRHKIGALPVVAGDCVLGIITETDFLHVAREALIGRPPRPLVGGF